MVWCIYMSKITKIHHMAHGIHAFLTKNLRYIQWKLSWNIKIFETSSHNFNFAFILPRVTWKFHKIMRWDNNLSGFPYLKGQLSSEGPLYDTLTQVIRAIKFHKIMWWDNYHSGFPSLWDFCFVWRNMNSSPYNQVNHYSRIQITKYLSLTDPTSEIMDMGYRSLSHKTAFPGLSNI